MVGYGAINLYNDIKSCVDQDMKECELKLGITLMKTGMRLKEVIERQIPKKVDVSNVNEYTADYKCPICGMRCITKMDGEWLAGMKYPHCYICGQKLDWEDT